MVQKVGAGLFANTVGNRLKQGREYPVKPGGKAGPS